MPPVSDRAPPYCVVTSSGECWQVAREFGDGRPREPLATGIFSVVIAGTVARLLDQDLDEAAQLELMLVEARKACPLAVPVKS